MAAFISMPTSTSTSALPAQTVVMAGAALAMAAKSKLSAAVPNIAMPRNMKLAPTVLKMKYLKASRRASAVSSCTRAT